MFQGKICSCYTLQKTAFGILNSVAQEIII